MPVMAIAMATGLAFTTKADVQSNGWVERNGAAYQLQNDPCNSGTSDQCLVRFTDDPNAVHQVYMTSNLQQIKQGGSPTGNAYIIEN